MPINPDKMMETALAEARKAYEAGEVPVGAAIFDATTGECIAKAHNRTERDCDPTAHAELLAIKQACQKLGTTKLTNHILCVTLEPCAMCAQGIAWAQVKELRFGAHDTKSGGVIHGARIFNHRTCHHKPAVHGGFMEGVCAEILRSFFASKRGMGAVSSDYFQEHVDER